KHFGNLSLDLRVSPLAAILAASSFRTKENYLRPIQQKKKKTKDSSSFIGEDEELGFSFYFVDSSSSVITDLTNS
ncbi:unnamed protein product, partial [Brassica napus]